MLKNLLALIGALALVVAVGGYAKYGSKVAALDSQAIPTYMNMFDKVLETGDASKGMVLK